MNNINKRYMLISFVVILVGIWTLCYNKVNHGIPLEYNPQKYSTDQIIKLDNFETTVNGITKVSDIDPNINKPVYHYIINLTVKNVSAEDGSLKLFYTDSHLVNTKNLINSDCILEPIFNKIDYNIKPEESRIIELTFELGDDIQNDIIDYYIPYDLYRKDIDENKVNLKRNQKYVEFSIVQ